MRRVRVLVVDDDATLARMMQRALPECDVHLAGDGRAALEQIASGQVFDVIFVDLLLPVMPGWIFFEHLKARSIALAERVVFVTAGAQTPDVARFLEGVPPTRVLEKPFRLEHLRTLATRSRSLT